MAATATDGFERLYSRYARDVYRFALSVVRNPEEAEDVTQTAFLNAFRAYRRGERPERPHSWLIAIAHNAIRSRRRWTLRRPREVVLEAAASVPAPAPAERAELTEVLRALAALPENQRHALTLRELEGRSYPEIAATLGVSVAAVESLISRARRTLRRQRELLRGLFLLPLRHGDEASSGLAVKAGAVAAAAGLAAGGLVVGSSVGGAARRPTPPPAQRSHAVQSLPIAAAAVAVPARRAVRRMRTPVGRRAAAPSSAPAAAAAEPPSAPAASASAAPAPAAPRAAAAPAAARTTPAAVPSASASTTATTTAAALATVTPPPSVTTPQETVETPVAAVSVPAVTVPVPPPPTAPQLPPPPSVPQVPGLPGIK